MREREGEEGREREHQTNRPSKNLQQAMWPYTVMYELSKEHAEPIEPTVIRAAVATNITLRPTISARDPATVER